MRAEQIRQERLGDSTRATFLQSSSMRFQHLLPALDGLRDPLSLGEPRDTTTVLRGRKPYPPEITNLEGNLSFQDVSFPNRPSVTLSF